MISLAYTSIENIEIIKYMLYSHLAKQNHVRQKYNKHYLFKLSLDLASLSKIEKFIQL